MPSLEEREAFARSWGGVLLRTQQEDHYADRLRADPHGVLTEAGVAVRPGAAVVIEAVDFDETPYLEHQLELYAAGQAGDTYRFLVPVTRVEVQELTEKELDGVAAGASYMCVTRPDFTS